MAFRFRRSIKIMPGVRVNVGKRGVSASVGVRGAHVTLSKAGTRSTVGIPGTGASWTDYKPHANPAPAAKGSSAGPLWSVAIVLAVIVLAALFR